VQLMERVRLFLALGGMPAVIDNYRQDESLQEADGIKESILSTYQDDFAKYGERVKGERLRKMFVELPRHVGERLKYSRVDPHERAKDLARALDMLCLARVAHRVIHSSGNGVPLGAEEKRRRFKVLCLDVGLMARACGLSLLDFQGDDLVQINIGACCEQFVGQHLLYSRRLDETPELHFWTREKQGSAAEVDYIISVGHHIVPVEVKAGKAGRLKSLHSFLREKQRDLGLRVGGAPPSLVEATTALPDGKNVPFRLLSLPLYLVGQVRRLCTAL